MCITLGSLGLARCCGIPSMDTFIGDGEYFLTQVPEILKVRRAHSP
jgi:hypothetical protein